MAAAVLVEGPVRGLNSVAPMLSLGEPKGEGDTGRLPELPMTPGGSEDIGEANDAVAPVEEAEARLVEDKFEKVWFQGRGEARGEPDPMTPGCGRELALEALEFGHAELGAELSVARPLEPR